MSDLALAASMGAQAVTLALVSRIRWRCGSDGNCTSGCTEHSLQDAGGVDAQEFVVADQRVLLVSGKIN